MRALTRDEFATEAAAPADGEVLDPDRGKAGLAICPGGDVVDFEILLAPPG